MCWALLPGKVAEAEAGKEISASTAVLFLPCPDATCALGLEVWLTAHRMPPGTSSLCCQARWGDEPADDHLLSMAHACHIPQELLPVATPTLVLHECTGSCPPHLGTGHKGTPTMGCPEMW